MKNKRIYLQSDSDSGEIGIFKIAPVEERLKTVNQFLNDEFRQGYFSLYELNPETNELFNVAGAVDGEKCWGVNSAGEIIDRFF